MKKNMTAYLQHRRRAACLPKPLAGRGMAPAPEVELAGMHRPPAWLEEVSERLEQGSPPPQIPPFLLPPGKCRNRLI